MSDILSLSGLACPHWDRQARGTWAGLSIDHGAEDLMKAILEGIAFRAAEVMRAMNALVPATGPLSIDSTVCLYKSRAAELTTRQCMARMAQQQPAAAQARKQQAVWLGAGSSQDWDR